MDSTNADVPAAGGQLSGDTAKAAAIKRLKALQEQGQKAAGSPPSQMIGPPR
jgi:hypothetical protein